MAEQQSLDLDFSNRIQDVLQFAIEHEKKFIKWLGDRHDAMHVANGEQPCAPYTPEQITKIRANLLGDFQYMEGMIAAEQVRQSLQSLFGPKIKARVMEFHVRPAENAPVDKPDSDG